ncbi:hypothetical protein BXT84_03075 [Sulfobacillus thermotolerans]|uniref:Uncharacterized protein n=1 Tax=Sulfobacillus thermotolerans TaxID=338644 RepID=A0ABN5GX65_9FIRM|nr:hypothetical protein BXT84_03075 [Sulfobacillus thermotolerans]
MTFRAAIQRNQTEQKPPRSVPERLAAHGLKLAIFFQPNLDNLPKYRYWILLYLVKHCTIQ